LVSTDLFFKYFKRFLNKTQKQCKGNIQKKAANIVVLFVDKQEEKITFAQTHP
jgi:hypothetical protein